MDSPFFRGTKEENVGGEPSVVSVIAPHSPCWVDNTDFWLGGSNTMRGGKELYIRKDVERV